MGTRMASLQTSALILCVLAGACATDLPDNSPQPAAAGTATGGNSTAGAGSANSGGTSTGGATGGVSAAGNTTGGNSTGGNAAGGNATGGNVTGGNSTGGSATGGSMTGGNSTGGSMTGGAPSGGSSTGGNSTGGNSTGGSMTGGNSTGGNSTGGSMTGGAPSGGNSGSSTGGASGGGGSGNAGGPPTAPDCNAAMPSGAQEHSGNGSGGQGNLAWEIWSNTGQGELTTYATPAFIATWDNAGGYLGRLGFEWGRFGSDPLPHTQRGTIAAQFVARRTGSAGGYSYVGMYGWTTNPCVEWYVVDDSFNPMPINPGNTTNEGERQIDGGTYIMYTRPTTGSGGTRCSGVTDWMQYYSVRKTARACGVISLTEHFNAWQSLGMDMSGDLLEAKILVEVGGGVGNVQLPIANVVVY
jgi:endo-1,4-beta-xylanase